MLTCIPDVLDWTEIKKIRAMVAEGEFQDGKKTAGYRAKRVKHNRQMDPTSEAAKEIMEIVQTGLWRNSTFQRVALPKSMRPPMISHYQEGMNYGLHVDDALMGSGAKTRSDVSVTVYLSNPDDYDGGETVMNSSFGKQEIKLPAGAAVVYPSSTLHRVAPVTRGERLAAVTWVQSHVRDPAKREILGDLRSMRDKLVELRPEEEEADLAFKTYSNLLRMWSE